MSQNHMGTHDTKGMEHDDGIEKHPDHGVAHNMSLNHNREKEILEQKTIRDGVGFPVGFNEGVKERNEKNGLENIREQTDLRMQHREGSLITDMQQSAMENNSLRTYPSLSSQESTSPRLEQKKDVIDKSKPPTNSTQIQISSIQRTQSAPSNISNTQENNNDKQNYVFKKTSKSLASSPHRTEKASISTPKPDSSKKAQTVTHTRAQSSLPIIKNIPLQNNDPVHLSNHPISTIPIVNHTNNIQSSATIPNLNQPNTKSSQTIVERSPGARYVRFDEILGNGAYKHVYRAYDTTEGIEVAWNVVNLSGTPKKDRSRIVNEVRLLERLHHANIISFYGSWVNRELEQVIFVTEILSSGTLKSFINKVQVIRWKIAKRWAIQILKGLEYLHGQEPPVIHRDLKCDNIFINGTSGDLRIGDFGLSTNISNRSNNKALSVLGTPEFMAPELYDESYDEKVDIYAFGMCLLEIFTKEVPYSECANPAQIFKKVTRNIPPLSISRLKSQEAKDFISLCLGYAESNETGLHDGDTEFIYQRPSATELLKHPFLMEKGDDDDLEVEVGPPALDMIDEKGNAGSAAFSSNIKLPTPAVVVPPISEDTKPSPTEIDRSTGVKNVTPLQNATPNTLSRTYSIEDENDDNSVDHFTNMPETEINIKNVTVLMGRDVQITDDDNDDNKHFPNKNQSQSRGSSYTVTPTNHVPTIDATSKHPNDVMRKNDGENEISKDGNLEKLATSTNTEPHGNYIVAANVEESTGSEDNDKILLNLTLPIEGSAQDVQFEFHLVKDDPVKVAKEMVTELPIPETATLEISEIISGLARDSRVNQDLVRKKRLMSTGSDRPLNENEPFMPNPSVPTSEHHQQLQPQPHIQSQAQNQIHLDSPNQQIPPQVLQRPGPHHSFQQSTTQQHVAPQNDLNSSSQISGHWSQIHQHPQPHVSQIPINANTSQTMIQNDEKENLSAYVTSQQVANDPQTLHQLSQQASGVSMQGNDEKMIRTHMLTPHVPNQRGQMSGQQRPNLQHHQQRQPVSLQFEITPHKPSIPNTSTDNTTVSHRPQPIVETVHSNQYSQHLPIAPNQQISRVTSQQISDLGVKKTELSVQTNLHNTADLLSPSFNLNHTGNVDGRNSSKTQSTQQRQIAAMNTEHHEAPIFDFLSDDIDTSKSIQPSSNAMTTNNISLQAPIQKVESEIITSEINRLALKKLTEEYEKNVIHAKKAYDTRMDNLQRSMQVKEEEHKKMIEKHKRELQEFERRKKMAEVEQAKRLQTLKKKWENDQHLLVQQDADAHKKEIMKQSNQQMKIDDLSTKDLIDFSTEITENQKHETIESASTSLTSSSGSQIV